MLLTAWFCASPSGLITLSTLPEVGWVRLMERRGKAPSTRLGLPSGLQAWSDRVGAQPHSGRSPGLFAAPMQPSLVDTQVLIGVGPQSRDPKLGSNARTAGWSVSLTVQLGTAN
jgi:hypothetical protein